MIDYRIDSWYNMIKESKGIIDACLHAIRCIPYITNVKICASKEISY